MSYLSLMSHPTCLSSSNSYSSFFSYCTLFLLFSLFSSSSSSSSPPLLLLLLLLTFLPLLLDPLFDSFPRKTMMDVLFCYVKEHPDPGYRQGMHELLAPILFVLHLECRDDIDIDDSLRYIYNIPCVYVYVCKCIIEYKIMFVFMYW